MEHTPSSKGTANRVPKKEVRTQDQRIDLDEWFKNRNIPVEEAKKVARQIKKQYPILSIALDELKGVEPELELIQLVFDVQRGRFPVTQRNRRGE